ncbi:GNAT family N-acetyltransferase [Sediminibacillus albus]|uniref:Ribosomal protein S18 acetylase RimI n=1 Tax=Sediminibacillus albus TaxID=407036 RepID=A0A1G9AKF8_9BACI|nr:GNAT family N-acetyltransferase [Sediminibacillus albus]SDK27822.1 Ribosomal protein S18 acetylase RimI [Sediminibacillus albus]
MIGNSKEYHYANLCHIIRPAIEEDAKSLSVVRLQADGETENLDREKGEAYISESGFKQIIKDDTVSMNNLLLVAEVNQTIVGFSRCQGNKLKRSSHRVDFGLCVLKEYWGYKIGKNLLRESIDWADSNGIKKITLKVLETNEKAIMLYKKHGFEEEGVLKRDKVLSDGNYYHTILMARFNIVEHANTKK